MKLEELLDNDLFVFDLDRTIWECYNKYNRSIWAKQLLYPYKKLNDDLIEDDVLSQCILQPNIRDILKYLKENKEAPVSEIAGKINLSFKATSKHLGVLSAIDIIERDQRSSRMFYSLSAKQEPSIKYIISIL